MKTVPFNKAEALAGRSVYHKIQLQTLKEHGRVIYVQDNRAWVDWADVSNITHTDYLVHEDFTPEPPTPRPVDLLSLNWPSIWVRDAGGSAFLVTIVKKDGAFSLRGSDAVFRSDVAHLEYAPTPSGPWRPMVE